MTGTRTCQGAAVGTNFCLPCGLSIRESQSTEKEEEKPRQEDRECSLTPSFFHFLGPALFLPMGAERNLYMLRIDPPPYYLRWVFPTYNQGP